MAELSFSTTLQGQPITIDGRPYSIKHPDAFSLRDSGLLEIKRVQIWKLLQLQRTPEQDEILVDLLVEFCQMVTDAPGELIEKMRESPAQLVNFAMAFMTLRSRQRGETEANAMEEVTRAFEDAIPIPTRRGSPSSPDSADSSAAIPGPGGPSTREA
jgi:hypothetical protein